MRRAAHKGRVDDCPQLAMRCGRVERGSPAGLRLALAMAWRLVKGAPRRRTQFRVFGGECGFAASGFRFMWFRWSRAFDSPRFLTLLKSGRDVPDRLFENRVGVEPRCVNLESALGNHQW